MSYVEGEDCDWTCVLSIHQIYNKVIRSLLSDSMDNHGIWILSRFFHALNSSITL